jgi:hypothetical protein
MFFATRIRIRIRLLIRLLILPSSSKNSKKNLDFYCFAELGTRSFFRGSLSAPHSIFFLWIADAHAFIFEFPFSLAAQTLVAQTVDR